MLRVRPHTEADDAELRSWFRTPPELRRFAGPDVDWPLTGEQLERWRADPRIRAWSAVRISDDGLVGYAQLIDLDPASARLARVAVAPAARGAGVGTALLTDVLDEARALGFGCIDLNVFADNHAAMRLYESLGFSVLGPTPGHPGVHRMGRRLRSE